VTHCRTRRLISILQIQAALAGRCLLSLSAAAHADTPPQAPDTLAPSPGQVDLRSGTYKVNKTLLAIGPAQKGAIDFRRITRSYQKYDPVGRMAQFNHNWDIRFRVHTNGSAGHYTSSVAVTSDELSYSFTEAGTYETLASSAGYAVLTKTLVGSNYYYTLQASNGTTVVSQTVAPGTIALAKSVTRADGTIYTLNYDALGPSGAARLRSVTSNAGYALLLEYTANPNAFVSKACVINLAYTTMPANGLCPAGAHAVSYGYSGIVATSETDADGQVWPFASSYVDDHTDFQEKYFLPGATAPYLTVNYGYQDSYQLAVSSQTFSDGRTFDYGWLSVYPDATTELPSGLVSSYYSLNGKIYQTPFAYYRANVYVPVKVSGGPSSVTDPLSRTTTYEWCMSTCALPSLVSMTLPDGEKTSFTYDGYRNVTQASTAPVPGSPLAARVVKATFDCATLVHCTSPSSITDANNNETDFSYDATHGQILTQTGPAVNGIRPQTRYSYAQRYAWISNGAGGYVQAGSPIWVLTQESYCKVGAAAASGTGCALGSSDEVTTSYDYGPDSGHNNLLVRGKVVSADGVALRTCYGYDYWGNKISQTSPRAGLTSCP